MSKAKGTYVPERGDLVWVRFTPQAGHEQAGHRPAVVVSPAAYNRLLGLALVMPVTNRAKGYPFEVPIPAGAAVSGVILADQLKSIDWRARGVQFKGRLDEETMRAAIGRVLALVDPDSEFTVEESGG
jgi:mRNA interferase MazF